MLAKVAGRGHASEERSCDGNLRDPEGSGDRGNRQRGCNRDFTSNGILQVMLFADRLEVWNPRLLPPSLTLEKLREPHRSVPRDPLLAECLYLAKYIERMETGTLDMLEQCASAGLAPPEFAVSDGFIARVRRRERLKAAM